MVANQIEYFGLSGAARRFCIDGKAVHASTVFRWMKDGISRGGHRVRLGYVRMGRRLATTQEHIDAFTRELAAADAFPAEIEQAAPPTIKPTQRSDAERTA